VHLFLAGKELSEADQFEKKEGKIMSCLTL
jgi:hypothetical protein